MTQKIFLLSVFLIFVGTVQPAHAGILVEPYLSYQAKGTFSAQSASNMTYSGLGYGGRLGISEMGLLLGAEYFADNNLTLTQSNGTTLNVSDTNLGAFLGIKMGSFRLIGTYFLSADSHDTNTTNGVTDYDVDQTGNGYKIGLFYSPMMFVSFGLEYYNDIYTKTKDNLTNTTTNLVPVNSRQAFLLTLSLPLSVL